MRQQRQSELTGASTACWEAQSTQGRAMMAQCDRRCRGGHRRCRTAGLLLRRCWSLLQSTGSALALSWADLGLGLPRRGAAPPLTVSKMFANCEGELVRIRYRWDSRWYIAKLKSQDVDGSYTAILSDGFIQFGTPEADVWRGNFRLSDDESSLLVANDVAVAEADEEDLTIWTAAKFGDAALIQSLMDQGAPHDEPEPLKGGQSGRTPLYWACLCGHTEAARLLLRAGATDPDGAAWDAVTAAVGDVGDKNVIEDASADLRYDPDEGIDEALIGEFGEDQPGAAEGDGGSENTQPPEEAGEDGEEPADSGGSAGGGLRAIRDLLVSHGFGRHRVLPSSFSYGGAVPAANAVFVNGRVRSSTPEEDAAAALEPRDVAAVPSAGAAAAAAAAAARDLAARQGGGSSSSSNRSNGHASDSEERGGATVCVVCWEAQISAVAVPCGHAVACWDCLVKVRKMRVSGCPLCRGQIRQVCRLQQPPAVRARSSSGGSSQAPTLGRGNAGGPSGDSGSSSATLSGAGSRQRTPQEYAEG